MLQEQLEKLNRQNTEHSHGKAEADNQRGEGGGSGGKRQESAELILNGQFTAEAESEDRKKGTHWKEEGGDLFQDSESDEVEEKVEDVTPEQTVEDDGNKKHIGEAEESSTLDKASLSPQERYFY